MRRAGSASGENTEQNRLRVARTQEWLQPEVAIHRDELGVQLDQLIKPHDS